jgi:hypothetical protein
VHDPENWVPVFQTALDPDHAPPKTGAWLEFAPNHRVLAIFEEAGYRVFPKARAKDDKSVAGNLR